MTCFENENLISNISHNSHIPQSDAQLEYPTSSSATARAGYMIRQFLQKKSISYIKYASKMTKVDMNMVLNSLL